MIKVIKEGKLDNYRFKTTCPICGCEFEYELVDLHKKYDYSVVLTTFPAQYRYIRYVECPCCHERIAHDAGCDFHTDNEEIMSPLTVTNDSTPKKLTKEEIDNNMFKVNYDNPGVVWSENTIGEIDCDKCLNKPKFKDGQPIVGDTPCTWCPRMQPKCM